MQTKSLRKEAKMNQERRTGIKNEISKLEQIFQIEEEKVSDVIEDIIADIRANVENIMIDEQDSFDNLPSAFQYGKNGQISRECLDLMQNAVDQLEAIDLDAVGDDLREALEEIIGLLQNVVAA